MARWVNVTMKCLGVGRSAIFPATRSYSVDSRTGSPYEITVDSTADAASNAAAAKAKEVAEAARKVTAYTALWIFVSLLVGAFYSSLAATWGGRQRDPHSYLRRIT